MSSDRMSVPRVAPMPRLLGARPSIASRARPLAVLSKRSLPMRKEREIALMPQRRMVMCRGRKSGHNGDIGYDSRQSRPGPIPDPLFSYYSLDGDSLDCRTSPSGARVFQVLRYFARSLTERLQSNRRLMASWITIQLVAGVVSMGLYVWTTYQTQRPGFWFSFVDVGCSLLFAADYAITLLIADSWQRAIKSPTMLFDPLTWAPSLLQCVVEGFHMEMVLDLRWMRVFRSLRVLRLGLLSGTLSQVGGGRSRGVPDSAAQRLLGRGFNWVLFQVLASLFVLIYTSTSLIQAVEQIPWHDALYFVVTTFTTVGFGDIVPTSMLSRVAVCVMMVVGVVLIPVQATQLYNQIRRMKEVVGPLPAQGEPFVLVSARAEVRTFRDFFNEFFHELHASNLSSSTRMLCLSDVKPTMEFKAFQELNDQSMTVVEGSCLTENDLIRAEAESASAVLLLGDRFSNSIHSEDMRILFQVWALKSYTKAAPLYVQTLQEETIGRVAPFLDPDRDVVVSVEHFRYASMALSCVCPGASTLLANLLRKVDVPPEAFQESEMANRQWLRAYANGCAYNVYNAAVGSRLSGHPFLSVSRRVFLQTGCTIIGVVVGNGGVLLNPASLRLRPGDMVLILARSLDEATDAANIEFEESRQGSAEAPTHRATGQNRRNRKPEKRWRQSWAKTAATPSTVSENSDGQLVWAEELNHTVESDTAKTGGAAKNERPVAKTEDNANASSLSSVKSDVGGVVSAAIHLLEDKVAPVMRKKAVDTVPYDKDDQLSAAGVKISAAPVNAATSWPSPGPPRAGQTFAASLRTAEYIGPLSHAEWSAAVAGGDDPHHQPVEPCLNVEAADSVDGGEQDLLPLAATNDNGRDLALGGSGVVLTLELSGGSLWAHSARSYGSDKWLGEEREPLRAEATWHSSIRQSEELLSIAADRRGADKKQPSEEEEQLRENNKAVDTNKKAADLDGHILLSGCLSSMPGFVRSLTRCDPTSSPPSIVVISPERPPLHIWNKLKELATVLHVAGVPSDPAVLKTVNADAARAVIHLTSSQGPSVGGAGGVVTDSETEMESMSSDSTAQVGSLSPAASSRWQGQDGVLGDADALLVCYGVGEDEYQTEMVHTVVELSFTSSVRFLQPGLLLRGRAEAVSSGSPAVAGAPRQSWVMRKSQEDAVVREGLASWQANPYYAAGRVAVPAIIDTFSCECFFNGGLMVDVLTELSGDDGRPGGALLRQVSVPSELLPSGDEPAATYGQLYDLFVTRHQMVPLGLYRRKAENSAWRLPYVAANPPPETVLQPEDKVFVLRPRLSRSNGQPSSPSAQGP